MRKNVMEAKADDSTALLIHEIETDREEKSTTSQKPDDSTPYGGNSTLMPNDGSKNDKCTWTDVTKIFKNI